jgi:hypothetical protein
MRIYVKEIPDEVHHQHKVFLVHCKGNQVEKVFTTVYKNIKGDIIIDVIANKVIADDSDAVFILQDDQQKKFTARFHWRDSDHHDYFTVFCNPIN